MVNADVYKEVTSQTSTPIHTGEQIYLRENFKVAVGGTVILLTPPLHSYRNPYERGSGVQQNDSLAGGYSKALIETKAVNVLGPVSLLPLLFFSISILSHTRQHKVSGSTVPRFKEPRGRIARLTP